MPPNHSESTESPTSAAAAPVVVLPARLQREYEVVAKLGQVGMGAVYQARHQRLKRFVAIKVLPSEKTKDAAAVARFQREMEAIGQLRHPNVIEAHDAGEDDDIHFLIIEYVDGLDLTAVVNAVKTTVADAASVGTRTLAASATGLRVADACEIVRQAALGLQHAHEHGLVHRDIKPSNLLLGWTEGQRSRSRETSGPEVSIDPNHRTLTSSATPNSATVKILDLGLALLHGEHIVVEDLTSTGQVMGTIDYMAPEQIADTHRVDIRADIYSLGCTLYRLLAGKAPFAGPEFTTLFKKMKAHESSVVEPLRQLRADVPPELETLLHRMLAKSPAERFALPLDVPRAIEPFLCRSQPDRAVGHRSSRAATSLVRRRRRTTTGHTSLDDVEHGDSRRWWRTRLACDG